MTRSIAAVSDPTHHAIGPLLAVESAALRVPVSDGGTVRYANLDVAASAPPLSAVASAVAELLPWYASVHRGDGYAARIMTDVLEAARTDVGDFVRARPEDQVVFTRNTTDALNLLAAALPTGTSVVTFASEHHANLLPWRRRGACVLAIPASPTAALAQLDDALATSAPGPRLVAVTGAGNVTGDVWPLAGVVEVARRHAARVVVDGAQLVPHRSVDVQALGVDWLAFSGHKLGAPFGAGALVGRADWLDAAEPYLAGGGAAKRIGLEDGAWHTGPARHEAGTPNALGVAALGAACRVLAEAGMARVEEHESRLLTRLLDGLEGFAGVRVLSLWPGHDRVGVVSFVLEGHSPAAVAAALSDEFGIGLRHGKFCAHPLVDHLTTHDNHAGAVRASLGVANSSDDVDRLFAALAALQARGPERATRSRGDESGILSAPPTLPEFRYLGRASLKSA